MSGVLCFSSVLVLPCSARLQKAGWKFFLPVKLQTGHVDEKISPEPLLTCNFNSGVDRLFKVLAVLFYFGALKLNRQLFLLQNFAKMSPNKQAQIPAFLSFMTCPACLSNDVWRENLVKIHVRLSSD